MIGSLVVLATLLSDYGFSLM